MKLLLTLFLFITPVLASEPQSTSHLISVQLQWIDANGEEVIGCRPRKIICQPGQPTYFRIKPKPNTVEYKVESRFLDNVIFVYVAQIQTDLSGKEGIIAERDFQATSSAPIKVSIGSEFLMVTATTVPGPNQKATTKQ